MLNELFEAGEYIFATKKGAEHPRRIHPAILLHDSSFNGMERFLTTIARFFLFHDDADAEEGRLRAEAALRMWCGHAPGDRKKSELAEQYAYLEENYPWLDHWLENYLTEYYNERAASGDKSAKKKLENAIESLHSKEKHYDTSSLNKLPTTNDFKLIRYDKVIANALTARGPLKRYYLVCRDPDWDAKIHIGDKWDLPPKQEDRILKTVAAYLLERSRKQRREDVPRYEPTNLKDIAYWALADARLDRTHYDKDMVEDRKLFLFEKGGSGNQAKIKPDPEWFAACGWQLIEATDDDEALDAYLDNYPDAIFYSDRGSNHSLARSMRYHR